ncbi:hypothetical protein BDC45DRAFT_512635 [Circinella umbellata]|nr:hypothetical protein BDC45DRAFT_512635 [Circinella umbellata]
MYIQFDEQDSPEKSPVEQKVSASQIKKELNGPKDTSESIAVIGIVRDTSDEEDLENVTVGGYGVVWERDAFPIQSGSYAGEANLNIFMELAASKAILELCPPERPLFIVLKSSNLISLINTKKLPNEKRKRIMKPLMEEVRSLVLKRTAKVQAVRYRSEVPKWTESYQTAVKEATAAREERLRLRPVKLEKVLDRSAVQQGIQEEQKQVHESTIPENNQVDLSTPVTTPTTTDIQKPSLSVPAPAPAPPAPVSAPETLSSTPEEATSDRRNGKYHDHETNSTIATDEQSKTLIEESIKSADGDSVQEEMITTTTTTTTATITTAPTIESSGLKRMRTEDMDNGEPTTHDEPNTKKKVKLTVETSSQNDTVTQNDTNNENHGTQTGWLSWVKTMFGIKQ